MQASRTKFQVSSLCAQVFSDHASLLDSGMCDVVVIATPNMTHARILLDVLAHPKTHHILVEKPLCTTVEDCYKVNTASTECLHSSCSDLSV